MQNLTLHYAALQNKITMEVSSSGDELRLQRPVAPAVSKSKPRLAGM